MDTAPPSGQGKQLSGRELCSLANIACDRGRGSFSLPVVFLFHFVSVAVFACVAVLLLFQA